MDRLFTVYLGPLRSYVEENPHLIQTIPGFLLNPESLTMYIGRTHIALEYTGSEVAEKIKPLNGVRVQTRNLIPSECNLFEEIVGFKYDSNSSMPFLPLPPYSEDLLFPTNKGWDKLSELKWNFAAQNSIAAFNSPTLRPMEGQFSRIVNGMFFDADESGLKTRHIKWIDFFPVSFDESNEEFDRIGFDIDNIAELVERDANYTYSMPDDYKYTQLPKINRFIEIWGNLQSTEPDITSHIAKPENKFILTMKFGATDIFSELTCEWQSETRNNIRPDFFVLQPNGYAEIVEFKLPNIDKSFLVGSENRESFSSWLNSYISQTRVYAEYFDDPNNRRWFEEKYGFKVYKPRRWLVVGRRSDFTSHVWREIAADHRDLEILTFDDLIDGVVVQFYK
ncbi:TPA: Shedu anti-phage system protein SduA domain-containing protein [Pseudomonas putida]|uniref:Shedu anti-phage system protein SduA domain-containing protein n=1 Tax=Pseudomonas TaxID=286 RepID=UPI0015950F2A|nr:MULTISPECIES: Shedu anti-phage system protein SduA domain-containing protein [Pseudomonas]MDN5518401.1 DUF4263 domain-containing protein [Pseudomonas sp.]MDN5531634.1 DUF4263 domain-containing protein [Pseudomonas sp.]